MSAIACMVLAGLAGAASGDAPPTAADRAAPADPAQPGAEPAPEPEPAPAAAEETSWSFSLSAYTYIVPDDVYVQPTARADRGRLHLEARYNYEELETLSVFAGWTFASEGELEASLTPMLGLVAGETDGLAPGLEFDLGWRARKLAGMKPEDVPITARVADKLCELGRFGQKTNRGYYIYPEGSRAGQPDPEVVQIVEATSAELGIQRRPIADDEVLKRCLYPLINEGARILEAGIAIRPCDIDIVYINGYGFPEVTGGPMFWADKQGLDNILNDIRKFRAEYGDFWTPAPLLERLVSEGKTFASLQQG